MFCPDLDAFPEKVDIKTASFGVLKKLYELEQTELVKFSYGLTFRVLNPSNLECQNLSLSYKYLMNM